MDRCRRRVRVLTLLLIVIPAVIVAACSRDLAQPASSTEAATNVEPTDEGITTAVQARFYAEPAVRDARIQVSTDEQVVTLSGTATSDQTRQRAVELARGVEGVTRVDDHTSVAPSNDTGARAAAPNPQARRTDVPSGDNRTPGWITTKIQAQYFVHPSIKPWNIDVTTSSDGAVTLDGQVDSMEARDEALRIARTTEGVRRVEDRLRVATGGETAATTGTRDVDVSDAWLTAKVQSKYYLDDDVRGRDIDVTTNNGVVTLEGTVASIEERRRAVALARSTDGVCDVSNRLQVRAPETAASRDVAPRDGGIRGSAVVRGIEDTWITTRIQSQYFLEPDVKGHRIDVDTRNGVVTLSGSVDSAARKQQAEVIARDTDGVRRVVNRLTVTAQP